MHSDRDINSHWEHQGPIEMETNQAKWVTHRGRFGTVFVGLRAGLGFSCCNLLHPVYHQLIYFYKNYIEPT